MTTKDEIAKALRDLRNEKRVSKTLNREQRLEKLIASVERMQDRDKKAVAAQRLQRAIAEQHSVSTWTLTVKKAVAGNDPLSLELDMILLPLDKPNGNQQLVPATEADNIITSALHKPIRAMFDGESVVGHKGADDVGVITQVWNDAGNIRAQGIVWTERNEGLQDYLTATAEHYGSFEIYYARSEDRNGIQYLFDTVFAAQTLVSNPAYKGLTPIKVRA